jgi:hypothetical protein
VSKGEVEMPLQSRKDWQEFKKAHPDFEKSKNFKSDVGPQLDQFDKAREEFAALAHAAQEKLTLKAQQVVKIGNSVGAALKGYDAVVKELEATDKSIRTDFNKKHRDSFVNAYVQPYGRKVRVLIGDDDFST